MTPMTSVKFPDGLLWSGPLLAQRLKPVHVSTIVALDVYRRFENEGLGSQFRMPKESTEAC